MQFNPAISKPMNNLLPNPIWRRRTVSAKPLFGKRFAGELVDLGYIRRERGRGTFVSTCPPGQGRTNSPASLRRCDGGGSRPVRGSWKLVSSPPTTTAEKVDVSAGAEVFILRRVRLAEGEPIGIQTSHIPLELAPGLSDHPMENVSLYEILQKKFGRQPGQSSRDSFRGTAEGRGSEVARRSARFSCPRG